MKSFLIGLVLISNVATAGVITGNNIHWAGDNAIIGTAYGMGKSVEQAELDALGAIFVGLKAAKNKPLIASCLEGGEIQDDGTCPSNGPIVVAIAIVR